MGFLVVVAFAALLAVIAASPLIVGYLLYRPLFRLIHHAEPGLVVHFPSAAFAAQMLFATAVFCGVVLGFYVHGARRWRRATPAQRRRAFRHSDMDRARRVSRIFMAVAVLSGVGMVWSLRPRLVLTDETLTVVSLMSERSVAYERITEVRVRTRSFRGGLTYNLQLAARGEAVVGIDTSPAIVAWVVAVLPGPVDCLFQLEPAGAVRARDALKQAMDATSNRRGLRVDKACRVERR